MTQSASFSSLRSRIATAAIAVALLLLPLNVAHADLKPETTEGYARYIAALEARLAAANRSPDQFLWTDRDANRRRSVQAGSIVTKEIMSQNLPGGGMLQHWIGAVFLPSATLARVRSIDEDYPDYAKFYSPDLTDPHVLEHRGNRYVVSYRIHKKQVLSVVLATTHTIDYQPLSEDRLAEQSTSVSVRQVENAGTASERVLPKGKGDGYLWAMNSYWRLQERDGGVYVECEAVTLSRDVPFGMGAIVSPILRSFAEDSLKTTLEQKRRAVASAR